MIQLAYFSAVSAIWVPLDTGVVLQVSRHNNALREITGLLVYDKRQYLQVLEGPKASVLELFRTIQRDERHSGVTELFRQPILHRDFHGWSMAYQELDSIDPDSSNFADSQEAFDIGSLNAAETRSLLQLLKRPPVRRGPRDFEMA